MNIVLSGPLLAVFLAAAPLTTDPPAVVPVEASSYFSAEEIARGKRYRRAKLGLFALRLALVVVVLGWLLLRGEAFMAALTARVPAPLAPAIAAVLTALVVWLAVLPVEFASGWLHERSWGVGQQSLGGWFADWTKARALSLVLLVICATAVVALGRRLPASWWLWAWAGATLLAAALVWVAPVVIDPLFTRFRPLDDPPLEARLGALAERAGVRASAIEVAEESVRTTKVNAYVTGLGNTKRIVLFDTLLRTYAPEEVAAIVAHELGHWRRKHVQRGFVVAALGGLVAFGLGAFILRWGFGQAWLGISGWADPRVIPLLWLMVLTFNLAALPLGGALSRRFERQADWDALVLTDDPASAVRVEQRLATQNLADVTPHPALTWFLATHPPPLERIALVRAYERLRAGAEP